MVLRWKVAGVKFLWAVLVRVLDMRVEAVSKVDGRRGITRTGKESRLV